MKLLKNYDCIEYYLSKADAVVNAHSRKAIGSLAYIQLMKLPVLV